MSFDQFHPTFSCPPPPPPPPLPHPRPPPPPRLFRSEKPVQRRPGARQRRVLRARALQSTLTFTQLGILRKDDFFKVVLDPGPDKREKRILGPAPPKRSTGVHLAQPCRQPSAKLIHSIGCGRERQFCGTLCRDCYSSGWDHGPWQHPGTP